MRLIGWAMCLLSLVGGPAGAGAPTVKVSPDSQRIELSQLEYMIDPRGDWQPGQEPPGTWKAMAGHAGRGNFGSSTSTIWLRLGLVAQPGAEGEWLWVMPNPQLEHVTMWVDAASPAPQLRQGGLAAVQSGQGPSARFPVMSLHLKPHEQHTVHIRVRSDTLLQVPAELWRPSAWREQELRDHTLLAAYFGLVAGLLVYNGFLAFRLKDAAYGYYFAFGSALATFQLANTGMGPRLLWPQAAMTTHLVLSLSACAFGAMALMFTEHFLRLRTAAPRLCRVIRFSAASWALVVMAHAVLTPAQITNWLIVPLGSWTLMLIQWSGVAGVGLGSPAAAYFLVGWSGLVMAGGTRVLLQLGWLPPHPLLYDAILIASAIEMLLLSLALADRIMVERRARALADTRREREQAAREAAQRALDEKSNFLAAVMHDLQQPIYAMSLATESVSRQGGAGVHAQALNQMRSALHAADDMLGSLAMAVRLERAQVPPAISEFSMQDMLERIDTLFETRAQERRLQWRVLPSMAVVHSDPALLERMVCNLVSNALRYTDRGGVLLSCRLRKTHLLIQVWDTGRGIPGDEHAAVFQMHYRGNRADTPAQGTGLGLGLSIVQRCATLLNIRVGLRSVPGRGSCFSLWVPLATAPAGHG